MIISSQEYEAIVKEEKKLKGKDTTVGISKCIDGRLSTIHGESRVFKAHETMAGKLETEEIAQPNGSTKTVLKSERLVEAIKDEVKKGPLLEILLAHTDSHDASHGCGAMMQAQARHPETYPIGTDLVSANLNEHKTAAMAIDTLYNEAAEFFGKPQQQKTAIRGVYDTHTLGVIFGYGEETKTLATTDIARNIALQPERYLIFTGGDFDPANFYPGVIQPDLQQLDKLIDNEKMIMTLSKQLLREHNPFLAEVNEYIGQHPDLSQLSKEQQQALRFYLARTTALQYLSKSYEGVHPFVGHDEILQSVSPDGVSFGQFLPEQIFGANPNDSEVVDHIVTQCALMNKNARITEKPHILFVSGVLSANQGVSSAERAKARNLAYFKNIINDPQIRQLIASGDLLPVPVLINDKTREFIALQDPIGAI